MNKAAIAGVLFFLSVSAGQAEVVGKAVEYRHGDTVLEGYLAYDDAVQGKRPAVMVVHEWKGLNDYARRRAEQLAGMGYVGFAIDMYGKGVRPQTHEEAGKVSGAYREDRTLTRERAKAAYDYLVSQEPVDPAKIAAIGYCFGGMTVLEMARAGFDLKGVASFHGSLGTPVPAQKGGIKPRVLVFQGAEDKFTLPDVEKFKQEMEDAGANWQLVMLPGAVHSFTVPEAGSDPSTGAAYNADADQKSWGMLTRFLKEIFG